MQETGRGHSCVRSATWAGVSPLYLIDVDLLHWKHGLHHPPGFCRIGIADRLGQCARNDLPRKAVFVLEPAALLSAWISAFGQLLPVVVNFFLRLAIDLKRNGLVELEDRAPVQGREGLPLELESHGHYRARRPAVDLATSLRMTADGPNLRILEYRCVIPRGFFGLIVKPQTRGDPIFARHGAYLPVGRVTKRGFKNRARRQSLRRAELARRLLSISTLQQPALP